MFSSSLIILMLNSKSLVKGIKIIVLVIIIIKINDSITIHFIWFTANLTLPLMLNNVYPDISLWIVLLCYVGSQTL